MVRRLLLHWLCLLILNNATATHIWDWGADVRRSSVVAMKVGATRMWKKNTYIQLEVQECMQVKYVRIRVHNDNSSPVVYYNTVTNMVLIAHELIQHAASPYDIEAKGIPIPKCVVDDYERMSRSKGKEKEAGNGKRYGGRNGRNPNRFEGNQAFIRGKGQYSSNAGRNDQYPPYDKCDYCQCETNGGGNYEPPNNNTDILPNPTAVHSQPEPSGDNGQHNKTYLEKEEDTDEVDTIIY